MCVFINKYEKLSLIYPQYSLLSISVYIRLPPRQREKEKRNDKQEKKYQKETPATHTASPVGPSLLLSKLERHTGTESYPAPSHDLTIPAEKKG